MARTPVRQRSSNAVLMPRMRIPTWVAVAVPAAAYAIRSLIRGSLRPDLPSDAIVFGVLVLALVLGTTYRRATKPGSDELTDEVDAPDDTEDRGR